MYDPEAGSIEDLSAPPYDVISPLDQDRLYRASPFNVVRLILGKDEPGDRSSENKYTRAASYLRSWRDQGVLRRTSRPALYAYELGFRFGGEDRLIRGVIAEVELEPFGGSILPHERTMPGPVEDRLALLRAVRANLSPVYTVFVQRSPEMATFLEGAMAGPPDRTLVDESGTRHRMWAVTDRRAEGELCSGLDARPFMIADGHHRYTVALAYRREMRARFGPGPWDSMMMFIVDAGTEGPPVLPIHRVVMGDPPHNGFGGLVVRDMAETLASVRDDDVSFGLVRMEDGELTHRVVQLGGSPPTVRALHEQVLDKLERAELRFVPDSVAAEQAVRSGKASAAFLLPPTRVERLWTVIRAGAELPQKSTYFWPKPRTGMVIRPLDD